MDWQDLRCFHECARQGTLFAAAQTLGMNATTVSRRISKLEADLDCRLFDRDGSSWTLTAIGRSTLEATDRISQEADQVHRTAFGEKKGLEGRLRVTSGGEFMRRFLAPVVWEFGAQYPMVRLELISSDTYLQLDRQEADIAFRATDSLPNDAIAKRLFSYELAIYCHFEKFGALKAGQLPALTFSHHADGPPLWFKDLPSPPRARHAVDNDTLIAQAVEQGAAVSLLPRPIGDNNPNLMRIEPSLPIPSQDIWILYHKDVRSNRRLRVFRDFAIEKLGNSAGLFQQ